MDDEVGPALRALEQHRDEIIAEVLSIQDRLVPRIRDVSHELREEQLAPLLRAIEHLLQGSSPEMLLGIASDLVTERLRNGLTLVDVTTLSYCNLMGIRRALCATRGAAEGAVLYETIERRAMLPAMEAVTRLLNDVAHKRGAP